MNVYQSSNGSPKPFEKIRNISIIFACIAVGYGSLFGPISGKNSEIPNPADSSNHAQKAIEANISESGATTQMSIIDGKLVPGTDKPSQIFKDYIIGRIAEIKKAGMVQYVDPKAPKANSSQIKQVLPPASHAPATVPAAPLASTPQQEASGTPDASKQTLHPAPFVDEAARASIEAKKKALIESGTSGVVKIGYHVDGSKMSEAEKQEQVRQTLSAIPDEWTIIYKSPNEKVRLYVFTDTTCPYCRKFHHNMDQVLAAGISVHYLLYPRDQVNAPANQLSSTAVNMKNIWCSVDQHRAFDDAFAGYRIPDADCANLPKDINRMPAPVPDHFLAGDMFDVQFTPTFFASNGQIGYGFKDANTLISKILK